MEISLHSTTKLMNEFSSKTLHSALKSISHFIRHTSGMKLKRLLLIGGIHKGYPHLGVGRELATMRTKLNRERGPSCKWT